VTAGWEDLAACKGKTALFFPEEGESYGPALVICRACPVRAECAAAGVRERFGCWGGETPLVRAERRRDPARVPAVCQHGHVLALVGVYWFGNRWGCRVCRDTAKRRWDRKQQAS
jgi:hypothetical protein